MCVILKLVTASRSRTFTVGRVHIFFPRIITQESEQEDGVQKYTMEVGWK
jgi:hypothetical protein